MRVIDLLPANPDNMPKVRLDKAHSPNKVLAHETLLRKFARGESFNPVHLRLGITGRCNMRCEFCNFHSPKETGFYDRFSFKDELKTDVVLALLSDFAASGGKAVTFCGSGESTIHSGFGRICRQAFNMGLELGLITNGVQLRREGVVEIVADTHKWLRIGLNAGTAQTFSKITKMQPEAFEVVLGAAALLKARSKDPEFCVGYNYVITADNYMEIEVAAERAAASGADYVRFEPEFYSALGHKTIEEQIDSISAALERASQLSRGDFEVSVPKLDRGPMDQTEAVEGAFDRCHYSRFVTAVGADGHLYPCPQVHLNSRYRVGDVSEKGYAGVLNDGPRHEWEQQNPLRTDLCKTCFYRPQNELLQAVKSGALSVERALDEYRAAEGPAPLHKNFV